MFEHLNHQIILVTGPQRSGTSICARMVAHDTGHTYIDETLFEISNANAFNDLLISAFRHGHEIVVQCPAMCRHVHLYGSRSVLIIMMIRSVEAILKSQARIEWDGEDRERERYEFLLINDSDSDLPIAQIKYDFWRSEQQFLINTSKEVVYSDLNVHPLWVPRDERLNFTARQTTRDIPESELISVEPKS